MPTPDFRGARGANAGDDFHELWVLRHALALLDQGSTLKAIAVEGMAPEDERGTRADTWDGVDATLYVGGYSATTATEVAIQQFKYSAANPDAKWTIARLTSATNKKADNSVIGRLAAAWAGVRRIRPELVEKDSVRVRLISNQPLDPAAAAAFSPTSGACSDTRRQALAASGLSADDFAKFSRALDLSECGAGSRFDVEERILATLSSLREEDARATSYDLMRFVRTMMMPESKGDIITREKILVRLGFSDPAALFPCAPAVEKIHDPIVRSSARDIVDRLSRGQQYLCLHGEGGCGKTTILQELETLLPPGSVLVLFDCFGAGRYLDSDAYRHRRSDAFLQLSNDLAQHLRTPYLLTRSADLDYARAFKKRLEAAAHLTSARSSDALLVIAIDAADNSVSAAASMSPPEHSFVHDIAGLGELPANARVLLSARSGRLGSLRLPSRFEEVQMRGFTRDETAVLVRRRWAAVPEAWLDDFHHLSRGNPRVETYALDYAGTTPANALGYLRPMGKTLDNVFQDRVHVANQKSGNTRQISDLLGGLVALPHPAPVAELAAVTQQSEASVLDFCADLAPGIRVEEGVVGFADEDFEHFVQSKAQPALPLIRTRLAERLYERHRHDPYAARHVASALLLAGRGQDVLSLLESDRVPAAVRDPVVRRETQLQRLRIAMKVCRETGNSVDSVLTVLAGGEALRTGTAIQQLLVDNADLATAFAREATRAVLRDSKRVASHGRLLFELMAEDARRRDAISVRETHRRVAAWLERRSALAREEHAHLPEWSIAVADVVAEAEALLRVAGPVSAAAQLRRWRPRILAIQVAHDLACRLITRGDVELIRACITKRAVAQPWDLFLLVPLALATGSVDVAALQRGLACFVRHGTWLLPEQFLRDTDSKSPGALLLDVLLTACEIAIAHGGDEAVVRELLERVAASDLRQVDRLSARPIAIDATLRAHALLEQMSGRAADLRTYLVDTPLPPGDASDEQAKRRSVYAQERRTELEEMIGPLVELYDARAKAIAHRVAPAEFDKVLVSASVRVQRDGYRYSRNPSAIDVRARAARTAVLSMVVPGIDRQALLERALSALSSRREWLANAELEVLTTLGLDRSLHGQILAITSASFKFVRSARASAEEKCEALVQLARLVTNISPDDAAALFRSAVDAAAEIDQGVVHELALFAPLAKRAAPALDAPRRRTAALTIAAVAEDAGVRLSSVERFPWANVCEALAILDAPVAFAAVGRWDDGGIAERHYTLPTVIRTGLRQGDVAPAESAALLCLLERADEEVLDDIAQRARSEVPDPSAIAEELAGDELLRFGARASAAASIGRAVEGHSLGKWGQALTEAVEFTGRHPHASSSASAAIAPHTAEPFRLIAEQAGSFTTSHEIEKVTAAIREASKASEAYVSTSSALDAIGTRVSFADRVAHLEALLGCTSNELRDHDVAAALGRRLDAWSDSAAVTDWCGSRLLEVIAEDLPAFSRWLAHGESPLPALLRRACVAPSEILHALLGGIERSVEVLDAATVFALVSLASSYLGDGDAAGVIERFAGRLHARIPGGDEFVWDGRDIPLSASQGIARLLFAFMSDVDVRLRWRAVHATRRLARLEETETLNALIELYDRRTDASYRTPNAPFYWLAARLWLLIALDRVASERPSCIAQYGGWLASTATSGDLPHVLLRALAKRAALRLKHAGTLALSRKQQRALDRVNESPLQRKRRVVGVGEGTRQHEGKERRFHFDWVDTLPYWFDGAIRLFADVTRDDFLDVAERWIVDTWGVKDEAWRWDDEKRSGRFARGAYASMDHGHGSRPTMERFHTYLEWHAMWCAVGELLVSRSLGRLDDGDDRFEERVHRDLPTRDDVWLSDLRGPKPLEDALWSGPEKSDDWVDNATDDELLSEAGLKDLSPIIVGAYHETRAPSFYAEVRVNTALVSPRTASALVRALQTIDDPWDYRIPAERDHEAEIHASPYELRGWLNKGDGDPGSGCDERDPFRAGVRNVECRPGRLLMEALQLSASQDVNAWIRRGGDVAMRYLAWGDAPDDDDEGRRRHPTELRSAGWRLAIERDALRAFLELLGLDLIVEIGTTRRNKGYEDYSRIREEEAKEARFERVILLRGDGSIEGAEGRLGTWSTPGARTWARTRSRYAQPVDGSPRRGTHSRGKSRRHGRGSKKR